MANRLAESTSPYLLQHKDNPVDWYPWGDEAFDKAKSEGKPIFLSIGYSSCHWCHVMEHESFEDEEVANLLNSGFVSVKVDREERPDIDEAYMTAVQLSSGGGGWPMTLLLTPDRKPFFAGTYFPKEDRGQHPGLKSILRQIRVGWATKKAEFQKAASDFELALRQAMSRQAPKTFTELNLALLDQAVKALAVDFDPEFAGFGAAPKFPAHSAIAFLLEYAETRADNAELCSAALDMAVATLEAMSAGGIRDHVGGGYHRYAIDREWLVPHFEKMLYDNALFLANYSRAAKAIRASEPELATLFARCASEIVAWLSEEMAGPNGLYYSALDADSECGEGWYYTWPTSEIEQVLGANAAGFIAAYGCLPEGNYRDEATAKKTGRNIPHLADPGAAGFVDEIQTLNQARRSRPKPGLDDKQLVSWNGLLMSGFCATGEIEKADGIARALIAVVASYGRLPHQIAQGKPSGEAFLDDYAAYCVGILDLSEAFRERGDTDKANLYAREGNRLVDQMIGLFYDAENAGFYFTPTEHEVIFGRTKPVFDQPVPSGNSLAIQALLRIGNNELAEASLEAFKGWMERTPQATDAMLIAAMRFLSKKPETKPIESVEVVAEAPPTREVRARLEPKEIHADKDGVGRGAVVLEIPAGLHLNSHEPPARWLVPTSVEIEPLEAKVEYPVGKDDRYVGTLQLPFEVSLPKGESGADFTAKVTFQACTDQECLLKEERLLDGIVVSN